MYLLGFDIGSSSIKAALAEFSSGKRVKLVQEPASEMAIDAPQSGWAEQDPELWWGYVCAATKKLLSESQIKPSDIKSIGIAYQMHGLVALDSHDNLVRPAIIWCDGRAVQIGADAFDQLGESYCLEHYLNSPGNFTASKLKWVKENEPAVYARISKIMLPGDFIAYRMTDQIRTTVTGLSEGVFWDFKAHSLATELLKHYEIDPALIPESVENLTVQGRLSKTAAESMGLHPGTPITYRAGDQPNNAMALNVLKPGEVAATGGTSGVVYAVTDQPYYDKQSRVNGFAHVNHQLKIPRIGILLCINGAGIQYGWIKQHISQEGQTYFDLEKEAASVPVGSDGLLITPFGNGSERMFENKNLGAKIHFLEFNRHGRAHLYRATLEGIAFAFVYGITIMQEMGIHINVLRVGNDNLFLSEIFSQTIANLTGARIEMLDTNGALGAALASGVGVGAFASLADAQARIPIVKITEPNPDHPDHEAAYAKWRVALQNALEELK